MKIFEKKVNGWKSMLFFAKSSILGVWQNSQYASAFYVNVTNFENSISTSLLQRFAIT